MSCRLSCQRNWQFSFFPSALNAHFGSHPALAKTSNGTTATAGPTSPSAIRLGPHPSLTHHATIQTTCLLGRTPQSHERIGPADGFPSTRRSYPSATRRTAAHAATVWTHPSVQLMLHVCFRWSCLLSALECCHDEHWAGGLPSSLSSADVSVL